MENTRKVYFKNEHKKKIANFCITKSIKETE